jgi:hypothetical protein
VNAHRERPTSGSAFLVLRGINFLYSKCPLMEAAPVEQTAVIQRALVASSGGLERAINGRNAASILRAKRGNSRGRKVLGAVIGLVLFRVTGFDTVADVDDQGLHAQRQLLAADGVFDATSKAGHLVGIGAAAIKQHRVVLVRHQTGDDL